MPDTPSRAQIVIVGGGIIGASLAYHLTKLGLTDVVLLEQGELSGGTTWHAAGLVGQLRATESMTELIRYSTELYARLEEETGQSTGWKQTGSLSVARSPERMTALRRMASQARGFGVEVEMLTPQEAGEKWPLMRTDDLVGAAWLPGDGKANPTDLTQALIRGARSRGATVLQHAKVTGFQTSNGRITAVQTSAGDIECETVVNCAGQWAPQVAEMAGSWVPLHSCEHFYIVTDAIPGVSPDLPVLRDQDGHIYFKEEVGGVVMGGFEPNAKPWVGPFDIPDPFVFQLLEDDWEQFAPLMENAIQRMPVLETTGIKKFYNGPESFTPDNNFLMGRAPGVGNMFVLAGFNSSGIASAGGAGLAMAEWILAGEPTRDLWSVDIRRFSKFTSAETWLRDRSAETLGLHYAIHWPHHEAETGRPLRRSPIDHLLRERGAAMGSRLGWERPNWFAPQGVEPRNLYSFNHQNWRPYVNAEHLALRGGVGLIDQTAFSKFLLTGADVEERLQYLCAADMSVAPGRVVYTPVLNERGGYESDVTVTRLGPTEYLWVTGSGQYERDLDILRGEMAGTGTQVIDVTSAYAVLGVMGPRAAELLGGLSGADLSIEAFPLYTSKDLLLGPVPVKAARLSYVGDLGWELYVPTEYAVALYELLMSAGGRYGLTPVGHYAVDAMRIEKSYRAWGRELTPDYTPLEAGLAFSTKLKKDIGFRGREALEQQRAEGLRRRLVTVHLPGDEHAVWGGELLLRDGEPVGQLTSAGYSAALGATAAMGYVAPRDTNVVVDAEYLSAGSYQIDLAGELLDVEVGLKSRFDPTGLRMKGDSR